jgi:hypothetical protein
MKMSAAFQEILDELDEESNLSDSDREDLEEVIWLYKHTEECRTCTNSLKVSIMQEIGKFAIEVIGPTCNEFQGMIKKAKGFQ